MNDANRPIVAEYGNAGVLLNLNQWTQRGYAHCDHDSICPAVPEMVIMYYLSESQY